MMSDTDTTKGKRRQAHLLAAVSFILGLAMIGSWGWLGSARPVLSGSLFGLLAGLAFTANGLGIVVGIWAALSNESARTLGLIGAACNASQPIFILLYSAAFPLAG